MPKPKNWHEVLPARWGNRLMASKSQDGKTAWEETIRPSHDKCEKELKRKYPTYHVTSTEGLSDFILYTADNRFVELKPCRLDTNQRASYDRMYLSSIQEKKHKHVIRTGAFVGIKYYNKAGNKFRYSKVIKLTLKNIKGFCLSTHWKKRIDPDELFK